MRKIDHTTLMKGGSGNEPTDGGLDKRWWLVNKSDRAAAVYAVVKSIRDFDSRRQLQYQLNIGMYGNATMSKAAGISPIQLSQPGQSNRNKVTYNVIQSAGDTVTAKMAKNKPKPLFLTSGGDWKMQRKAKKLETFIEGVFYENDAYTQGIEAFRDAFVLGDGITHVFEHYGRVKHERVLAQELYVDPLEAYYGNPRQIHRVKSVDRAVLIDLFPEKRAAILRANSANTDLVGSQQNVSDQVSVCESWHLPSGPEATDGFHTINLETENLLDEEYKKDFFPFAKLPWSKGLYGYWSQSGAEQLAPLQTEIMALLWIIQRSMRLAGSFKVFTKIGSKVPKEHLNNEIGAIIEYVDTPPTYYVPPVVPMEYYQHLQTLKNLAFEQVGVSQLSAASQKPAGLNSGKALREFNDIETDRFQVIGQAYEQYQLEKAKLSISVAKDIYERDGKYEVKVPGKKFIKTIDWKDIDLDEDEYVMKIFPVSALSDDPAERLQTIQEYAQAGYLDPDTAQSLLEFPDLDRIENLINAQRDWINEVLDKIIEEGVSTPPEPEMNPAMAMRFVMQNIAYGHVNKIPDDRMQMLRDWKDALLATFPQLSPPPPQPAPAPGAQPQAVPAPPPQSDLLPNAPGVQ